MVEEKILLSVTIGGFLFRIVVLNRKGSLSILEFLEVITKIVQLQHVFLATLDGIANIVTKQTIDTIDSKEPTNVKWKRSADKKP